MFKSDEENLQKELMSLREKNKQLQQRIDELETLNEDNSRVLAAQESVGELSRKERLFAEATIQAYEKLIELSRNELIDTQKVVGAQESLHEYSRDNKIFLDSTIEAFIKVLELSRNELDEAYKTVGAYENLGELTRNEILSLTEKMKSLKSKHLHKTGK